jgi:hypothetical protein
MYSFVIRSDHETVHAGFTVGPGRVALLWVSGAGRQDGQEAPVPPPHRRQPLACH